jgi:hypothetical protein
MVEWKEANMVSALFVVGNGREIMRDRLVRRDTERDSLMFFKETVDLFNCQWHYNSSLTIVVYDRNLFYNVTSCCQVFVRERSTSVVPLIRDETSIEGK